MGKQIFRRRLFERCPIWRPEAALRWPMRAHQATASPGDRRSCSPRLHTWWALLSLGLSLCAHVAAQVVPIHRTDGEIPACACGWPNIVNGLAAKEQLCPPPGMKCSMCMEGVHMIRHQKHPRSACAGFKQHEENVGFCNKLGDEMYELKHEIQDLTLRVGS